MRTLIVLSICLVLAGFVAAEDKPLPKKGEKGVVPPKEHDWTGQWVVAKKPMSEIRFGNWVDGKEVYVDPTHLQACSVIEDRDGYLLVHNTYREGWVQKADFLAPMDAVNYWCGAVDAKPNDAFARFMRGVVRASIQHQADDALKDFSEAIRLDPTNATYYFLRSWYWVAVKPDLKKAIADYSEAIRHDPKNATYHWRRSEVYEKMNAIKEALDDCTEAIRIDSKCVQAYYYRGRLWIGQGEYDKAHHDFDEAIRLDKSSTDAYVCKAMAYRFQNDTVNALGTLEEALRINPADSTAYAIRSFLWMDLDRYDKAITDSESALKLDPKSQEALRAKAVANKKMGNYTEVLMAYTDLIAFAPDISAYESTAWFYSTCPKDIFRDGKKALEYLAKAKELNAKGVSYWKSLAAAYAETGQFELAVAEQTKVVDKLKSAKKPDAEDVKKAEAILEVYKSKKPYRDVGE